jgi:antitoxin ParD1/3/4
LAIIASFDKIALEELGALLVPTRNINLTDHYHEFVNVLVGSGRFKNASEVMRAGLRLLENETAEQAEKLTVLKRLANEGFDDLDQGRGTQLDSEENISAFVSELGKKARTKASG